MIMTSKDAINRFIQKFRYPSVLESLGITEIRDHSKNPDPENCNCPWCKVARGEEFIVIDSLKGLVND